MDHLCNYCICFPLEISCHPALQANAQSLNPRMASCQVLDLEMEGDSSFTLALVPFLLEYSPHSTTGVVELQCLQVSRVQNVFIAVVVLNRDAPNQILCNAS